MELILVCLFMSVCITFALFIVEGIMDKFSIKRVVGNFAVTSAVILLFLFAETFIT